MIAFTTIGHEYADFEIDFNEVMKVLDDVMVAKGKLLEPKKITLSKSFLGRLIKSGIVTKVNNYNMGALLGIPAAVIDDPLAPDYVIDY